MRSLSGAMSAAVAAGHVVMATLVKIAFPSGTIALNSSTHALTYDGTVYSGVGAGFGTISSVEDRGGELPGLQFELLRVDALYIGLALDDADEVQGSPISVYTALIDSSTYAIVGAELDWAGYADTMSISENGETASIVLTAESKGVDLLRGTPMVYNDADQQSLVPGDLYFQYVASQSDKPVVWPSRGWFYK
jgi:hypothetical protein